MIRARILMIEAESSIGAVLLEGLRKRGHAIHLFEKDKVITFSQIKNKFYVIVFSERDELDLKKVKTTIRNVTKDGNALWIAIVDEEGDITYYDTSILDIKGKIKAHKFPKGRCVLLDNRAIVFDKKLARVLFEKEFFGKPFGEWLQISFPQTKRDISDKIRIIPESCGYDLNASTSD